MSRAKFTVTDRPEHSCATLHTLTRPSTLHSHETVNWVLAYGLSNTGKVVTQDSWHRTNSHKDTVIITASISSLSQRLMMLRFTKVRAMSRSRGTLTYRLFSFTVLSSSHAPDAPVPSLVFMLFLKVRLSESNQLLFSGLNCFDMQNFTFITFEF